VTGVPSQRYGEEIIACIIKKAGSEVTEQEIKDYMSEKLARHKVPSYVVFMDSFPMTASGKIQKFRLREWAADHLNLQKKEQEGI
jgi:fatty-acyl-CoA synthase